VLQRNDYKHVGARRHADARAHTGPPACASTMFDQMVPK
jgi:hypothetical protein